MYVLKLHDKINKFIYLKKCKKIKFVKVKVH